MQVFGTSEAADVGDSDAGPVDAEVQEGASEDGRHGGVEQE